MSEWDVIIVGAGIAGAAAAHELAPTRRVVVLEREFQPGVHATGRSAAVFIDPYGNEVVQALTAASKGFLFDPPAGFADVPLVHDRELFLVAVEGQEEMLREFFEPLAPAFPQLALCGGGELEARVPLLHRGRVRAAMHDPGTKDIDVAALLQGFLRGAAQRGASVVAEAEVKGLGRNQGQWQVETSAGTHRAPVVVDAAGAWVGQIAEMAGASPLPLRPLQRSMFVVDPGEAPGWRNWPLVADVAEQWYFKPESGRLLVSPSEEDEVEPCDASPDDLTIATGVDRLEQVLDLRVKHIQRRWAGLRTFAEDRSPVVGFDPTLEGFFWLAGQGGFGIQTAPALGRVTAALVSGSRIPDDIRRHGVSEDAISPMRLCGTGRPS